MKRTLVSIFFITSIHVCCSQTSDWSFYTNSELFKSHVDMVKSFEYAIRTKQIDLIKQHLPDDSAWVKQNQSFFYDLAKSKDYFPICEPIDTSLSITNLFERNTTTFTYTYLCNDINRVENEFEYIIDFIIWWDNDITRNIEMEFREQATKDTLQKALDAIPPPPKKH